MKKIQRIVRSDLKKPQVYKKRNWPKYMEKIEPTQPKVENQVPVLNNTKKNEQVVLERTPVKDILELSV